MGVGSRNIAFGPGLTATWDHLAPATQSAEPIIAWRAWQVDDGRLRSLSAPTIWLPRTPCLGDPTQNEAGVYAFKERKDLEQYLGCGIGHLADHLVLGQVKLWGQIVEHELGYRAQFAMPWALTGGQDLDYWRTKYTTEYNHMPEWFIQRHAQDITRAFTECFARGGRLPFQWNFIEREASLSFHPLSNEMTAPEPELMSYHTLLFDRNPETKNFVLGLAPYTRRWVTLEELKTPELRDTQPPQAQA